MLISSVDRATAHDRWNAVALKMAGQSPLEAQPKKSSLRIYRIIIAPAWGSTWCIRIENNDMGGVISVNRLAYGDIETAQKKEIQLTGEEFLAFEEVVRKAGLDAMKLRDKTDGLDGDVWSLEISKAQFHDAVASWCPNAYDPQERGTAGFVKVFKWAADKAGITKSITNKGHSILDR
jgi:hypothetical protein